MSGYLQFTSCSYRHGLLQDPDLVLIPRNPGMRSLATAHSYRSTLTPNEGLGQGEFIINGPV